MKFVKVNVVGSDGYPHAFSKFREGVWVSLDQVGSVADFGTGRTVIYVRHAGELVIDDASAEEFLKRAREAEDI